MIHRDSRWPTIVALNKPNTTHDKEGNYVSEHHLEEESETGEEMFT